MKRIILAVVMSAVGVFMVDAWAQKIHAPMGFLGGCVSKVEQEGNGFFVQ